MKVVLLVTQLEGGGAQRASYRLAVSLREKGVHCENWFLYKKRDNFKGLGTTRVILSRPIRSAFDYLKISYNYYKLLKRSKPDVVIAFTHYANVLGLFIAFLAGVKVRIASHRNPSWGDMSKMLMSMDNIMAKTGVYTTITAVSESTKATYKYYPKSIYERIVVVKNGLIFPSVEKTKDACRETFSLSKDSKLIGTIGRLSRQKNHSTIIKAISDLPNVTLAIVGDGELRLETVQLIKELNMQDRVFLLGEIPYDHIPEFLKCLDVFVMPSLFEGLSNALVEAMSMGLPVLTSDVESQRDVVVSEDGSLNGILIPAEDIDAWRDEIHRLFLDPDKVNLLAMRSKARSMDFTMEKMADGFYTIIQSTRRDESE